MNFRSRWLRVFAILLFGFVGAGCANSDIPSFDFKKAKGLTVERRQQYDLIFFNEIETWNQNSNRYAKDSAVARKVEFQKMAQDGYLPAYVALRLLGISPATERDDPQALDMLIANAEAGDVSSMCAVALIPVRRETWGQKDFAGTMSRFVRQGVALGHGACEAEYGSWLLLGMFPAVSQDQKAAFPLLFSAAKKGYYLAAERMFRIRYSKALNKSFDFTDRAELDRALCWGRLAQQHTNWAFFDVFLEKLREYAIANKRPDLLEQSYRLDPKRIPITEKAVIPDDCIRTEART